MYVISVQISMYAHYAQLRKKPEVEFRNAIICRKKVYGDRLFPSDKEQYNYKIPQGVPYGYDDGRTWDNHATPRDAFQSIVDGFGERDMWRHNEFVWVYEHELTENKEG